MNRPARDVVLLQLAAADRIQFGGFDTIACEIPVQRVRVPVARLTIITKEHTAPTPSEHERGAKPCRSAADYDYVEHAADLCKEATKLWRAFN